MDKKIPYEQILSEWEPFNYVYMIVYLPEQEEQIKSILPDNCDPRLNRLNALRMAEAATQADPSDAFAWFNIGSNHVYFERYAEANAAYDKARELGLPQRMFRYQFGPFIANFQASRTDDLLALPSIPCSARKCPRRPGSGTDGRSTGKGTPPVQSRIGARPSPSARAMKMHWVVSGARYVAMDLDPAGRMLLGTLGGSRTVDELAALMQATLAQSGLDMPLGRLNELTWQQLCWFARQGPLI